MFTVIINQILKMILLILIGVLCYRLKLIDQKGNKMLANLLLMVINPPLVFMSMQSEFSPHLITGLLTSYMLAIFSHVIMILLSRWLIPSTGNVNYSIERYCIIYSNCGFIGLPLVQAVLGNEGVLYLTAYMVTFGFFTWTHGILLMNGASDVKSLMKGILSPALIACILGLICFLLQIHIPEILADTMNYLGGMNTPLAMIIAGVSIAQTNLSKMFLNKKIYFVTFCKLLLMPILLLFLLLILKPAPLVSYAALIAAACPVAATGTAFAIRFHKNYTYCSELYSFTTVCSLLTIPLFLYIAERLLV